MQRKPILINVGEIIICVLSLLHVAKGKYEPVLLINGGAGDITDERVPLKVNGMKISVDRGYKILFNGGSVIDAVEAAVMSMEDDPAFNAGYGSVLNLDGEVQMEASIQRGSDLAAGSTTLIQHFKHPISIAKKILENTPHSMLGGDGAKRFAISQGFEIVKPDSLISQDSLNALNDYLHNDLKASQEIGASVKRNNKKVEPGVGTVGAVAIDSEGHIAVATSTGGINGKYVGRIGDTPLIGAGTYADDFVGGVSCTGHGESILKVSLAHTIIKNMESGQSAQEATERALNYMTQRLNNTAGAITLSNTGEIGIYFTSNRMAWSYVKGTRIFWGVDKNEFNEDEYNPYT